MKNMLEKDLIDKIHANYLAIHNLEMIKKLGYVNNNANYTSSKNNILESLQNHLEEFKEMTGIEYKNSDYVSHTLFYFEL